VQQLSDALGCCSGLDSDEVDAQDIVELMRKYQSKTSQWQKYALADYSRPYTRNLVDKGNGKSNLVCSSSVHACILSSLTFCLANTRLDSWKGQSDS